MINQLEIHGFTRNGSIDATIEGVRATVPADDFSNRHRLMIAEWEAAGNVIPPYVEPVTPAPTLTKRQIIAALILGAEILDPDTAILGAIGNITDPLEQALALNDWKNAPFYVRSHPLFNSPELLSTMGMTSEEVDVLWDMAKVLPQ